MYGIALFCEVEAIYSRCVVYFSRSQPTMPARRLDDRIRYLSTQIARADNGELERILQELLEGIHQKLERLRIRAATRFLGGKPAEERRTPPF